MAAANMPGELCQKCVGAVLTPELFLKVSQRRWAKQLNKK